MGEGKRGGRGMGNGRGGGGKGRRGADRSGSQGIAPDGDGDPAGVRGMLSRVLEVMTGSASRDAPMGGSSFRSEPVYRGWSGYPGQVASGKAAIPSRERFPVPVVDPELCTGCGICQQVCGPEAIEVDEVAVIDETKCISCEACIQDCPEQAIFMPE